jgi:hypothetical protein
MNQHLFVDALRRIRYGLLVVGALAAVLWLLTGTGASGAAFGIAFSMSLAVISGPIAGSRSVAPKEALLRRSRDRRFGGRSGGSGQWSRPA